ncbi:cation:proton antiporter [Candidatus Micrarchaeota archaeon]|nr:cation:proton antiporter [Candidatus Micrarchaeota archaeon]
MKKHTHSLALLVLLVFVVFAMFIAGNSIFGSVIGEKYIYFEIALLFLLGILGEFIAKRTNQPSVVLLMLFGVILGPSFLLFAKGYFSFLPIQQILRSHELLSVFSQFGAIILLFRIGLESKVLSIFNKENFVIAVSGMVVPFLVGYGYASLSGESFVYSLFLGAALSATGITVIAALLRELHLVKKEFAQIIIGAAVIDDILGLLVLSLLINNPASFSLPVALVTLLICILFILGSLIVGNYIVHFLDEDEQLSKRRLALVVVLALFLGYVAEFININAIFGAFIAGLILNHSKHSKTIDEKTEILQILFTPIFFIGLGSYVDVNSVILFFGSIIIISFLAIISKIVSCYAAGIALKMDHRKALLVGVGMAPRGVFALLVASIGLTSGILSAAQYSIISAMAIISTVIVMPVLGNLLTKTIKSKV